MARSPARRLPRRRAGESLAVSIRGDENPSTAGDDRTPASGQAGAKLEGAFQADGLRRASIMGTPVRTRMSLLLARCPRCQRGLSPYRGRGSGRGRCRGLAKAHPDGKAAVGEERAEIPASEARDHAHNLIVFSRVTPWRRSGNAGREVERGQVPPH